MHKTFTSLNRTRGKGTSKGQRNNMCVWVFSKLNIGRHPNKQPRNLPNSPETKRDKAKDARRILLMKCPLNKSFVSEPNASQRNFIKEQRHKLSQWLLQTRERNPTFINITNLHRF